MNLWRKFTNHVKRNNEIIDDFNRTQWRFYWWLLAGIELTAALMFAYAPLDFEPFRGTLILSTAFISGGHFAIGLSR